MAKHTYACEVSAKFQLGGVGVARRRQIRGQLQGGFLFRRRVLARCHLSGFRRLAFVFFPPDSPIAGRRETGRGYFPPTGVRYFSL